MTAAEKVAREITWGVSVALAAGDPDGADRLVVARLAPLLEAVEGVLENEVGHSYHGLTVLKTSVVDALRAALTGAKG